MPINHNIESEILIKKNLCKFNHDPLPDNRPSYALQLSRHQGILFGSDSYCLCNI